MKKPFKRCPECGREWETRESFLHDPLVRFAGYQVNFQHPDQGLFLFNHDCGTTMGVPVGDFRSLHEGPVFTRSMCGTSECPGLCLQPENTAHCSSHCECAYAREIMQIILRWPKGTGPGRHSA